MVKMQMSLDTRAVVIADSHNQMTPEWHRRIFNDFDSFIGVKSEDDYRSKAHSSFIKSNLLLIK